MPWNPNTYNKFKAERYAPFQDLLASIQVKPGMRVIDLGCGTGELTSKLANQLPGAQVLGIDASAEMLKEAQAFATDRLQFRQQRIEEVVEGGQQYDLVFSHAALQWVDDHFNFFPQIMKMVAKGGQLAVQMPCNHEHFTHTSIVSLASTQPFKTALQGWTRKVPVLAMEVYAQMLFDNGGSQINIFEKAYPHVLTDADALADWTQGTALLPYMERLPDTMHAPFLQAYRALLREHWPQSPVFYPFKRILMTAVFDR